MERKDLRRAFKLVPHETALNRLAEAVGTVSIVSEEIGLEESLGRVLSEDVASKVDIPEQSQAVFDGYAVDSRDTVNASSMNPVVLKLEREVFPGDQQMEMSPGHAMYTACGAAVPKGADAVIKAENTRLAEKEIEIVFPIKPGENIAPPGEDVKKGQIIFRKGHLLRPQDLGLLAGLGTMSVKVLRRPIVGILSVGDELVQARKKDPDKMSNNYALIISGLVSEAGGIPKLLGIVPDDPDQIRERISEGLDETDIVATIAGCSVGPKDFVPDAVQALAKSGLVFHGINLSPGKVTGAGVVKNKPIIMLPGHIVSAMAGFYLFLAPLIAQYLGLPREAMFPILKARMTDAIKAKPTATFLRVSLTNLQGDLWARPVRGGSSLLTSLVDSNGFAIIPKGKGIEKGSLVDVVLYNRYEFAHLTSL